MGLQSWGPSAVPAELEEKPWEPTGPGSASELSRVTTQKDSQAIPLQVLARPFCQKPACPGRAPALAGLRNCPEGHTSTSMSLTSQEFLSKQPWPHLASLTTALCLCSHLQSLRNGYSRGQREGGKPTVRVGRLDVRGQDVQSMTFNPSESKIPQGERKGRTPLVSSIWALFSEARHPPPSPACRLPARPSPIPTQPPASFLDYLNTSLTTLCFF